jgi:hypothetical protein
VLAADSLIYWGITPRLDCDTRNAARKTAVRSAMQGSLFRFYVHEGHRHHGRLVSEWLRIHLTIAPRHRHAFALIGALLIVILGLTLL